MSGNDNKKEFIKISLKDKSKKNASLIKSISLIKKFKKVLPKKFIRKKLLGKKRKLLSIEKPMDIFINSLYMNTNTQKCAICLENINLNERHFLHCGHFFHCLCIGCFKKSSKREKILMIFECTSNVLRMNFGKFFKTSNRC